jgi:myo-inositol 2-dehydrogenase/D-chiro-inositol 1-dehydrogenase
MPDIEVVGVAARTDASLAAARELISPDVQTCHNYHDLLTNPRVGAVIIATPNSLHPEVASWAIRSGKHVLLEAPFGETPDQVFPLLDQAETGGRVFQGDLELGYLPVTHRLRELIAGGTLGELLSVSVALWCNWGFGGGDWPEESTRPGVFVWTGAWYVHVLDTLIGRLPERVSAIGVRAMNGPLMDHGWASLDYGRNLVGRFEFNLVAIEGQDIQVKIAGTRGEASADLTSGEYRWRSVEAKAWQSNVAPPAQPAPGFVGMRECLAGFVRAIREGEPVLADASVCRRVHQVIFALQRADDEGNAVQIIPTD